MPNFNLVYEQVITEAAVKIKASDIPKTKLKYNNLMNAEVRSQMEKNGNKAWPAEIATAKEFYDGVEFILTSEDDRKLHYAFKYNPKHTNSSNLLKIKVKLLGTTQQQTITTGLQPWDDMGWRG